jgi:hypothetical protein
MLVATWIGAIAAAVLALSVPVAWFTWLSARRQDRERRERERQDKERADLLKDVSQKFVSKDTFAGLGVLAGLVAILGIAGWLDARKPKP